LALAEIKKENIASQHARIGKLKNIKATNKYMQ
jgi:hypothetical protein